MITMTKQMVMTKIFAVMALIMIIMTQMGIMMTIKDNDDDNYFDSDFIEYIYNVGDSNEAEYIYGDKWCI